MATPAAVRGLLRRGCTTLLITTLPSTCDRRQSPSRQSVTKQSLARVLRDLKQAGKNER